MMIASLAVLAKANAQQKLFLKAIANMLSMQQNAPIVALV